MANFSNTKFERITISYDARYSWYVVHGWSTFPRHSVLAGQPCKSFIDSFPTEEAARTAYPQAQDGLSSKWTEPQVSLAHLPDENDPVAGGMYPDDIGNGNDADEFGYYEGDWS